MAQYLPPLHINRVFNTYDYNFQNGSLSYGYAENRYLRKVGSDTVSGIISFTNSLNISGTLNLTGAVSGSINGYLVSFYDLTSSIQSQFNTASSNISTLQSQMITANNNIATNSSNITTLKGQMTTANTNISTNTSNISTLQSQMTTANTNIATNTTNIVTNTTNIATNTTNISTLQSQMTTANTNIATNTTNISTLQGQMTTANTNIATNTTNISTLQSQMTTANTNIATNTTNISTLQGQMTTANTNIATNTTNISTLQGQMTSANTNISNLQTKTTNQSYVNNCTSFTGELQANDVASSVNAGVGKDLLVAGVSNLANLQVLNNISCGGLSTLGSVQYNFKMVGYLTNVGSYGMIPLCKTIHSTSGFCNGSVNLNTLLLGSGIILFLFPTNKIVMYDPAGFIIYIADNTNGSDIGYYSIPSGININQIFIYNNYVLVL